MSLAKAMVFPIVMYECVSFIIKKAECPELMLLNCSIREDSCWSWSSNTLAPERSWCWERLRAGREEGNRGWDGWMASPTQWKWIWAISGRQWKTRKPGWLQSIGSQRIRHDLAIEQQQPWSTWPKHGRTSILYSVLYWLEAHHEFVIFKGKGKCKDVNTSRWQKLGTVLVYTPQHLSVVVFLENKSQWSVLCMLIWFCIVSWTFEYYVDILWILL